MGSREEACIYNWKTAEQNDGTYSVYIWAISTTGSRRRWFVHEQPANAAAWKMKDVVGLKEAEGVFDSNQCVLRLRSGGNSMRVITNSKYLADELNLKYSDQRAQKVGGAKPVEKLGSFCRNIGYCQECVSLKGSIGYCQECFPLEVRCARVWRRN